MEKEGEALSGWGEQHVDHVYSRRQWDAFLGLRKGAGGSGGENTGFGSRTISHYWRRGQMPGQTVVQMGPGKVAHGGDLRTATCSLSC